MARRATDFSRFDGDSRLETIQKSLPPGITVNVNRNGEITFTVKVSQTNAFGYTTRKTVGTFGTVERAVRAYIDYKYASYLSAEYFSETTKAVEAVSAEITKANAASVSEQAIRNAVRSDALIDKALQSINTTHQRDIFKLLAVMPLHEVPEARDWETVHPYTGELMLVKRSDILAYYRFLESGGSVDIGNNSGESAAHLTSFQESSQSATSAMSAEDVEDAEDVEYSKEAEEQANRAAAFFGNTDDLLIVDELEDNKE